MTALVELWTALRRRFEAAGIESPVIDARLLLEAGAGVSRLDIITDPRRELTDAQVAAVEALAARRAAREPVSHILGRKGFWRLDLAVTPAVLTPRPETETLVEVALALAPADRPLRVLDLGVGSGAVLLAILNERPLARGVGVDLSPAALAVARANGAALALNDRIDWREGGWDCAEGPFDLIVSNPPYIPSGEIDALAPEVSRYEPRLALDGGADGLDAYRALAPFVARALAPGAGFALEVGKGQSEAVAALARAEGLGEIAIHDDLLGIGRVVAGRKPPAA